MQFKSNTERKIPRMEILNILVTLLLPPFAQVPFLFSLQRLI